MKMQKYLRLMNMRLDVVVKDIVGLTGSKIISDFVKSVVIIACLHPCFCFVC